MVTDFARVMCVCVYNEVRPLIRYSGNTCFITANSAHALVYTLNFPAGESKLNMIHGDTMPPRALICIMNSTHHLLNANKGTHPYNVIIHIGPKRRFVRNLWYEWQTTNIYKALPCEINWFTCSRGIIADYKDRRRKGALKVRKQVETSERKCNRVLWYLLLF